MSKKPKYYDEMNILLEEKNSIYFFIPKVACTSLKKVCADLIGIPLKTKSLEKEVHKIDFPYVLRSDLNEYENFFKFAFVRNPWDRVVSLFFNKMQSVSSLNSNFKSYSQFKTGMNFEEFVYAISEIPDEISNSHFKSQSKILPNINGTFFLDFIGKFESLEEDFEKVIHRINASPIILPHLMKSNRPRNYRDFYNQSTKEFIRKRYEEDIDRFKYNF